MTFDQLAEDIIPRRTCGLRLRIHHNHTPCCWRRCSREEIDSADKRGRERRLEARGGGGGERTEQQGGALEAGGAEGANAAGEQQRREPQGCPVCRSHDDCSPLHHGSLLQWGGAVARKACSTVCAKLLDSGGYVLGAQRGRPPSRSTLPRRDGGKQHGCGRRGGSALRCLCRESVAAQQEASAAKVTTTLRNDV